MLLQPTIEKLHTLRLTGMIKALEHQLKTPDIKKLSFEDRLGLLVDQELTERENRALSRRLKAAKLKHSACVEDIDYRRSRGVDKKTIRFLSTCRWINDHRNTLIVGPTGVGKTYLICALLHKACQQGFTTLYMRTPRLFNDLNIARADGTYNKFLRKLAKTNVLAIDDFGLIPLTDDMSRDLLEIIDDRSESASTVIASQLPIDNWHQTIKNATIADAILDRVVHNSYKLKLKGDSLRKCTEPDITKDANTEF